MMEVTIKQVKRMVTAGYDVNKLAPGILTSEYLTKSGAVIEWTIPLFER